MVALRGGYSLRMVVGLVGSGLMSLGFLDRMGLEENADVGVSGARGAGSDWP